MIIETNSASEGLAAEHLMSIKEAAKTVIQEMADEYKAKFKELERRAADAELKASRAAFGMGGAEERTPGRDAPRPEEVKAFERWARTGEYERKASEMSGVSDPAGGYTISGVLADRINEVAASMGAIRGAALVIPDASADFSQPIATSYAGVQRSTETSTRATTTTPDMADIKPTSCGYSAVAPVTNWLLQDSKYDISSFITRSIGKGIGLAEGYDFIAGNGVGRPSGILSYPIAAGADASRPFGTLERIASGETATLTVDSLIDLLYALAPAYRARAAFVMSPNALARVRKMKSSTSGDYVWQPGGVRGQPATLLGCPCLEDPNMPNVEAGANAVLCGDFVEGYIITDIGSPILIRDTVTVKGKTLFYVERRTGGAVLDSNAIKVLQIAES